MIDLLDNLLDIYVLFVSHLNFYRRYNEIAAEGTYLLLYED